jgi:hypothetical protein
MKILSQTEFFKQRGLGDKLHNLGETGNRLVDIRR